jgi:hypothetical protein
MYVSVSRVTGPWRAAFPENSHLSAIHDGKGLVPTPSPPTAPPFPTVCLYSMYLTQHHALNHFLEISTAYLLHHPLPHRCRHAHGIPNRTDSNFLLRRAAAATIAN